MPKFFKPHVSKMDSHGKTRWVVESRVDGKRTRRFYSSEEIAESEAGATRREAGGVGEMLGRFTNAEIYAIISSLDRLGSVSDLPLAVDQYLSRKRTVAATKTVDEVAECLVDIKKRAGKRPRYIQTLKSCLKLFSTATKKAPIHSISCEQIAEWIYKNKWSQATRKGRLIDLKTLFSFAESRGYISKNPINAVELPVVESKRPGILTPYKCRALLETVRHADPGLLPYVSIMAFAGIRPAEAIKLSTKNIQNGLVEITSEIAKDRRRRLVEVLPNLSAWLKLDGELPPHNARNRLLKVRGMLSMDWPHDCLRHSFASYHLAKFQSADKTAHQMGHASTQMLFAHYRELVTPSQADDYFNIFPF